MTPYARPFVSRQSLPVDEDDAEESWGIVRADAKDDKDLDPRVSAAIKDAVFDLKALGLSARIAEKVARAYEGSWREGLEAEAYGPYALAHVHKAPWAVADQFAQTVFDVALDNPARIRSAVFAALLRELTSGDCYSIVHTLVRAVAETLRVPVDVVMATLDEVPDGQQQLQFPFLRVGKQLWLTWIARDEERIVEVVWRLRDKPESAEPLWTLEDKRFDIELGPEQIDAVNLLQRAPIGVITGGPGTGKTTLLREACAVLQARGSKILLCAPTGKAARRMSNQTNMPAVTIHRLLGFNPAKGFEFGPHKPLIPEGIDATVIVDESSMLDVRLVTRLLCALGGAHIVFIGDVNQLAPVGPGAFFRDLIESKQVPVVRLQTVHRQGKGSWVAVNAPKILAGQPIALEDCEDFEFYDCDGEPSGLGSVVGDVLERLYAGGVDTFDTVVLSPRKTAGLAGSTADLNVQLQARFNPDGVEVEVGNQKFRVGDKTLQLKNNYELGALNGDLGVLTQVAYDRGRLLGAELLLGTLTDKVVKRMRRGVVGAQAAVPQRRRSTDAFTRAEEDLAAMRLQAETPPATVPTLEEDDARFAIFSKKELYDVSLGYALTIHKSQGSEWPIVVVVCHTVHGYQMLTRKLLYTALTRASQKVVLIGDQLGITRALATIQDDRRRTGLQVRLCE